MTESEWRDCAHPCAMLEAVRYRVSLRKLRLFGAACCRHVAPRFGVRAASYALISTARVLEGTSAEAAQCLTAAADFVPELHWLGEWLDEVDFQQVGAALALVTALEELAEVIGFARRSEEKAVYSELLREIVPFRRRTVEPGWLRWNGKCVKRLALGIADELRFDDLPVLGDALEDAGCQDEELLAHCRRIGGHTRGCWAVDVVLGK